MSEVLPICAAKIAVVEPLVELALGDPAELPAAVRLGALRDLAGDRREICATIDPLLDLGQVRGVADHLHDVVPEFGLDRRQELAVGRLGVEDGLREGLDEAAVGADVGIEDTAGAIGPEGALLVAHRAGQRVEPVDVVLEPGVGRVSVELGLAP